MILLTGHIAEVTIGGVFFVVGCLFLAGSRIYASQKTKDDGTGE